MKTAACGLLLLSLLFAGGAWYILLSSGPRAADDYREIMDYVSGVEKSGFKQSEFDEFALRRKAIQKDIFIDTAVARSLLVISITLGSSALVATSLSHRRKLG